LLQSVANADYFVFGMRGYLPLVECVEVKVLSWDDLALE